MLGLATSARQSQSARFTVSLARNPGEIEEAQRLRYKVFMEELGAKSASGSEGFQLDVDEFDAACEHLIVRDQASLEVVGCYRLMRPEIASQRGGFYSDQEFDLTRINHLRGSVVELGRACIHPEYRTGGVIMLLWTGLARLMSESGYAYAIGCASVNLAEGRANAIATCRQVMEKSLAPQEYRVFPKHPYPLGSGQLAECAGISRMPALLKGYIRLGAWIGGDPAWDPDFNTADLFILLPLARIPAAYTKHFFADRAAA